jgi:membrane-associated protein
MAVIVANIVTDVTEWLEEFSSNWWFLLIIFSMALLDSVLPIVPGETTVIAGGVAAGAGNQTLAFVIFAGALGAFLGDNLAYSIGHRFEPRVRAWAARKPNRAARIDAAGLQIKKRGGLLLITAASSRVDAPSSRCRPASRSSPACGSLRGLRSRQ